MIKFLKIVELATEETDVVTEVEELKYFEDLKAIKWDPEARKNLMKLTDQDYSDLIWAINDHVGGQSLTLEELNEIVINEFDYLLRLIGKEVKQ